MKLPPYSHFPTIAGKKVSLRQIELSDINNLIDISFYDSIEATTLQEAVEIQTKINTDYMNGNSIHWRIEHNLTNKIVGTCGYYRGFNNGEGELGWVLLPLYKGQEFMTPAMHLAIEFGINTIALKRIWAVTTQQNVKAIQLLKRLHFIKIADLPNDEIEYKFKSCIK